MMRGLIARCAHEMCACIALEACTRPQTQLVVLATITSRSSLRSSCLP